MHRSLIQGLSVLIVGLVVLPAAGWAQETWTLPESCYTQSVLDRACAARAAEDAQSRLQDLVERITEALRADASEAGEPADSEWNGKEWNKTRLRLFSELQRSWTAYRNALCNAAAYQHYGGSLSRPTRYACRRATALEQRRMLQMIYRLEVP